MEDESEKKLETQESEEHVVNSDTIVEELADEYSQYLKIDSDVEVIYFFVYKQWFRPRHCIRGGSRDSLDGHGVAQLWGNIFNNRWNQL